MIRSSLNVAVAALALGAWTPSTAQTILHGTGRAIDGDSLTVDGREVRLFGIDAPEWDQSCTREGKAWACGQEAAERLSQSVTGKQVRCETVGTDRHDRVLGRCSVGTTDINRMIVSSGFAIAFRRYSNEYVSAEDSARLAKRGMWAGKFSMPEDVRHSAEPAKAKPAPSARRPAKPPVAQSLKELRSGCTIKGNRGSNGWIYHLPGMPYYSRTKAEEVFCTEAEAQKAGYRRAKAR